MNAACAQLRGPTNSGLFRRRLAVYTDAVAEKERNHVIKSK